MKRQPFSLPFFFLNSPHNLPISLNYHTFSSKKYQGLRKILCLSIVGVVFLLLAPLGKSQKIELGIDRLERDHFQLLQGKRVGLVCNQTSLNAEGVKTRLVLKKNSHLVALFSPEHGIEGKVKAAKYVPSGRDKLTGLTVFSLYGPTREPTKKMLAGVDVLVFDLQDIGCRSYTYISTMALCLKACAKYHKEFVVLDRPNPLGGLRVEGMPLDPKWVSFVGQLPIPYVHGMTMGELALMANELHWMGPKADLKVVKMKGWSREMTWKKTGLRWVPSSPNIPYASSCFYYVVTGVVSELGVGIDIGVGGKHPFEFFTASWQKSDMLSYLRNKCPGMTVSADPKHHKGVLFKVPDTATGANLANASLYLLAESYRESKGAIFTHAPKSKLEIFYKVYGSSAIRKQLAHQSAETIIAGWQPFLSHFLAARRSYLLY